MQRVRRIAALPLDWARQQGARALQAHGRKARHACAAWGAFRQRDGTTMSLRAVWRPLSAAPSGSAAAMASHFSGALQLTDLDDFIGPSQVG